MYSALPDLCRPEDFAAWVRGVYRYSYFSTKPYAVGTHWGASNEYEQHNMFLWRSKKKHQHFLGEKRKLSGATAYNEDPNQAVIVQAELGLCCLQVEQDHFSCVGFCVI